MSKFLSLAVIFVANALSVFLLLWFLLGMNTYVNGLLIPQAIHETSWLLVLCQFMMLGLEAVGWLALMFMLNRRLIALWAARRRARELGMYIFTSELTLVVGLLCIFAYTVFFQ